MHKEFHILQEKLETTSYANPTSHLSFFQPANTDEELAKLDRKRRDRWSEQFGALTSHILVEKRGVF